MTRIMMCMFVASCVASRGAPSPDAGAAACGSGYPQGDVCELECVAAVEAGYGPNQGTPCPVTLPDVGGVTCGDGQSTYGFDNAGKLGCCAPSHADFVWRFYACN